MLVILVLGINILLIALMVRAGSPKNIESRTEREEEILKKHLDS